MSFAINMDNFSVSKLSSSALIVNLSMSVWTGRKLDKRVSEEVDQQNSTKTRAGNYNKNLLAGSGKLEENQQGCKRNPYMALHGDTTMG